MATSGGFNTNPYKTGGDSPKYYYFGWELTGQSTEGNYSDIKWWVEGAGGTNNTYWVEVEDRYVVVDGDRQEVIDSKQKTYNGTIAFSGTKRLYHDNSSGERSFSAEACGSFFYYSSYNSYGSGSWSLPKIARYTTVYNSLRSRTINTISINWSTTDARDWTQYSINGGAWKDAYDTVASDQKSGYYTISGLSPNTTYSIKTRCRRTDSGLWSEAGALSVTTYDMAKITEAPNFTDEENPTIKYSNPFGNSVATLQACISFDGSKDDIAYRDVTKTGTSYTFSLTDAERTVLRNKAANTNSLTVIFYLRTTYNGSSYHSTSSRTMSIVNANPTFSNFTYEDINTTTKNLTGSNQIIVKGYSNVIGKVSVANKATAQKSATMKEYRLTIGDKTGTGTYSSSAEVRVPTSGSLVGVSSATIEMYAIDSRSNSTKKTIALSSSNYKDYSSIKIATLAAERQGGVSSTTTLKFTAKYWNSSFGSVTNDIVTCKYRYKKTSQSDSSYVDGGTTLTYSKSNGTITGNLVIQGDKGASGFDVSYSYNIQLIVSDKLTSATSTITIGSGTPAIAIYKDNVAIGQKYDTTKGGKLQVSGDVNASGNINASGNLYLNGKSFLNMLYPVGSIYLSVNSTNPGTIFGGTWVQISGAFLYGTTLTSGTAGATGNGTGTATGASSGSTGSTAITVDQMPWHNHGQDSHSHQINGPEDTIASGGYNNSGNQWGADFIYGGEPSSWGFSKLSTFYTKESQPGIWGTGGGQGHTHSLNSHTHNIPYISVFVWKRTA